VLVAKLGRAPAALCLFLSLGILCALTSAPGLASTIPLDEFTTAGYSYYLAGQADWGPGNGTTWNAGKTIPPRIDDVTTLLGTKRTLTVSIEDPDTAPPTGMSGVIGVEPGTGLSVFRMSTAGPNPGHAAILYGTSTTDVDLTAQGNNRLRLRFLNVDTGDGASLPLKVVVTGTDNTQYTYDNSTVPLTEQSGVSYYDVFFNSTAWSGLPSGGTFATLTKAKSVEFIFNATSVRNVDFALDSIQLVPEPSAVVLLGALAACAGLAVVWRRRRK